MCPIAFVPGETILETLNAILIPTAISSSLFDVCCHCMSEERLQGRPLQCSGCDFFVHRGCQRAHRTERGCLALQVDCSVIGHTEQASDDSPSLALAPTDVANNYWTDDEIGAIRAVYVILRLQGSFNAADKKFSWTQPEKLRYLVTHCENVKKQTGPDQKNMSRSSTASLSRYERILLLSKVIESNLDPMERTSLETIFELCCMFAVNSFTWLNQSTSYLGIGFDPMVSLINHSCVPNCTVYVKANRIVAVKACQRIVPGDKLSISYLNPLMTKSQRQESLEYFFFFTCKCRICLDTVAVFDMPCSRSSEAIMQSVQKGISLQRDQTELAGRWLQRALSLLLSIQDIPLCREPIHTLLITILSNYQGVPELSRECYLLSFALYHLLITKTGIHEYMYSPLVVIHQLSCLHFGLRYLDTSNRIDVFAFNNVSHTVAMLANQVMITHDDEFKLKVVFQATRQLALYQARYPGRAIQEIGYDACVANLKSQFYDTFCTT